MGEHNRAPEDNRSGRWGTLSQGLLIAVAPVVLKWLLDHLG
jgi:hypothetical protein